MKRLDKRGGTVRVRPSIGDITRTYGGIHAVVETACGARLDASHCKLIISYLDAYGV